MPPKVRLVTRRACCLLAASFLLGVVGCDDGGRNYQLPEPPDLGAPLVDLATPDLAAAVCATCSADATCKVVNGAYACGCNPGFDGDGVTCTKLPCYPLCGANASCGGDAGCVCETGFMGDPVAGCSFDPCSPKPCFNAGTCAFDGKDGYVCTCAFGYSGTNCETPIDACKAAPCKNAGDCEVLGPGTYTCVCPSGFTGVNCETAFTACVPDNPCLHGGTCTATGPGSYTCTCPTGYTGAICQNAINACLPNNPCMNGGTCTSTGGGTYSCTCKAGYSGANCENAINACTPSPCKNGGTCASTGPGTYTCACTGGYTGTNCEIAPVSYCDVIYRLNSTPTNAASRCRLVITGGGAQDTLYNVGANYQTPSGVTTPFTSTAFPRGFMRLRFLDNKGAPGPGPVQMIEYYMPLEFGTGFTGATVTTDVDHSAGLLALRTTGCPTANYDACLPAGTTQTVSRPCQPIGSGVVGGTTLTWDACSLAPPAPPAANAGQAPGWTWDQSQISAATFAANPGCIKNVTAFGNVTCQGLLCAFVPGGLVGVKNATWDQKLANFVFSGSDFTTATISLAETTVPDSAANLYNSIRFAAATPIQVQCGFRPQLTCNVQ